MPGIGILKMVNTPASTDAITNRILPPFETILFKNEDRSAPAGLVYYIARQKNIDQNEAGELLVNFCNEWKDKIDEGGSLNLETVGSIVKNTDGVMIFEKEPSLTFLRPIDVNSIYQKTQPVEEHVVKEFLDPTAIIEVKEQEAIIVEKSYWGIWALILLAIGFVMLFYHYKAQKLTGSSIGNHYRIPMDSSGATYKLPK